MLTKDIFLEEIDRKIKINRNCRLKDLAIDFESLKNFMKLQSNHELISNVYKPLLDKNAFFLCLDLIAINNAKDSIKNIFLDHNFNALRNENYLMLLRDAILESGFSSHQDFHEVHSHLIELAVQHRFYNFLKSERSDLTKITSAKGNNLIQCLLGSDFFIQAFSRKDGEELLKCLKLLLGSGCPVSNLSNKFATSPLFLALSQPDIIAEPLLKELITHGASLYEKIDYPSNKENTLIGILFQIKPELVSKMIEFEDSLTRSKNLENEILKNLDEVDNGLVVKNKKI